MTRDQWEDAYIRLWFKIHEKPDVYEMAAATGQSYDTTKHACRRYGLPVVSHRGIAAHLNGRPLGACGTDLAVDQFMARH